MKSEALKSLLAQGLETQGIVLEDVEQDKLLDYLSLMAKWNKTHNLTAITEPKAMLSLHLLDSLSIYPYITGDNIIDVGTGAGLPGMVLAIVNPKRKFTLLDSCRKKTNFLTHIAHKLAVKNVNIVHERVEKFQPPEQFDVIISRAFSSLRQMVEYTYHLAGNHTLFLAMKGLYPQEEIAALPHSIEVEKVLPCQVPYVTAQRHIVLLRKKKEEEV